MIVKCLSTYPTEAQLHVLGPNFRRDRSFGVVLGREYLVIEMDVDPGTGGFGTGAWVGVLLEPDIPTLIKVPLCLFEVVEPKVSRYWEIRISLDGSIRLWPRSFYHEFYHDDLSDRDPKIVEDFWRVHALLKTEVEAGGWPTL